MRAAEEEAAKRAAEETRGMTLEEFEKLSEEKDSSIRLDEKFFKEFKADGILITIKDNPLLFKLYQEERLYISSKYRKITEIDYIIKETERLKEKYILDIKGLESKLKTEGDESTKKFLRQDISYNQVLISQCEEKIKKTKSFYNPDQDMEGILKRVATELKEYKTNKLASDLLLSTLEALDGVEGEGAEKLQVRIELFPKLKEGLKPGTTERADFYSSKSASRGFINLCPLNFPGTDIPERNTPTVLFGHEMYHVVDHVHSNDTRITIGTGFQSIHLLKEYCDLTKPEILKEGLKCLAKLCSETIIDASGYKFDDLAKNGTIDTECPAAAEFISFHMEKVVGILNDCGDDIEYFKEKYSRYIKTILNNFDTKYKENAPKYKLFALGARDSFMKECIKTMEPYDAKGVFEVVDQVYKENIDTTLDEIIKKDAIEKDIAELTEIYEKMKIEAEFKEAKDTLKNGLELFLKEFFDDLEDGEDESIKLENEGVQKIIDTVKQKYLQKFVSFKYDAPVLLYSKIINKLGKLSVSEDDRLKFEHLNKIISEVEEKFNEVMKQTAKGIIEKPDEEHDKEAEDKPTTSIDIDIDDDTDTPEERKAGTELSEKIKEAERLMQQAAQEQFKQLEELITDPKKKDVQKNIQEAIKKLLDDAKKAGVREEEIVKTREGLEKSFEEVYGEDTLFRESEPIEREPIGEVIGTEAPHGV